MDEKVEVQKTEQELMDEFYAKYLELCNKYGMNIVVTPTWRLSKDNGDWRLALQVTVGKMPVQR